MSRPYPPIPDDYFPVGGSEGFVPPALRARGGCSHRGCYDEDGHWDDCSIDDFRTEREPEDGDPGPEPEEA